MGSRDLYGPQVYVVAPGLGDGKLVALLGLSIILLRISFIWLARWQVGLLSLIVALALGATSIAAYDAFRTWEGDRTPWLYGEVFLGVIVALCAGVLMGARAREVPPEGGEVTEAWA
jgi:hypothetical protein